MDASIRLDYLLGNLRVPQNEVTPQEWVAIYRYFLGNDALKHLGSQKPLKEILNYRTVSGSFVISFDRGSEVVFPAELSWETLGWQFYSTWEAHARKSRELSGYFVVFTRDRQWLLVELSFMLVRETLTGQLRSVSVKILSDMEFEDCLGGQLRFGQRKKSFAGIGSEILKSIHRAIGEGIRNAELRLATLSSLRVSAENILNRME